VILQCIFSHPFTTQITFNIFVPVLVAGHRLCSYRWSGLHFIQFLLAFSLWLLLLLPKQDDTAGFALANGFGCHSILYHQFQHLLLLLFLQSFWVEISWRRLLLHHQRVLLYHRCIFLTCYMDFKLPELALADVEQGVTNWLQLWLFFLFGVELLLLGRRTSERAEKVWLSFLGIAGRAQVEITGAAMPIFLLKVDFGGIAIVAIHFHLLFALANFEQLMSAALDIWFLWCCSLSQQVAVVILFIFVRILYIQSWCL